MMNNLPDPILLNPATAVDSDTAFYACAVCASDSDWIDASDNLWHCTSCGTAHNWPADPA